MKAEEITIDLPDVKDIPGQEFVHVPPLGDLADTTISSDDEEGKGLFDDDAGNDYLRTGNDADVRRDEKSALENADNPLTIDEGNRRRASLDNSDFDGEDLNEKGSGN